MAERKKKLFEGSMVAIVTPFSKGRVDEKAFRDLLDFLNRGKWLRSLMAKVEPGCEVGMEACAGAHHWARMLVARGYRVKLMAPQFVKPYVKSNKNDRQDAEAISIYSVKMFKENNRALAVLGRPSSAVDKRKLRHHQVNPNACVEE